MSFSPFNWIRDAFGIHKDAVDTRKAQLEIEKLEQEKVQRESPIILATLEDVHKYDPKVAQIENDKISRLLMWSIRTKSGNILLILLPLLILGGMLFLQVRSAWFINSGPPSVIQKMQTEIHVTVDWIIESLKEKQ